jgi:cleavage stimulation factor subunit 3
VRRAYQRALLVPSAQLEALWRGYEGFEMGGSNKQLARRLLDEWRPLYQAGGSARLGRRLGGGPGDSC